MASLGTLETDMRDDATAATELPVLGFPRETGEALEEALEWFSHLPEEGPLGERAVENSRGRLRKAGLSLVNKECRGRYCSLSFDYSEKRSSDLRERLSGDQFVIERHGWSFTTFLDDGTARGHMFFIRKQTG